MKIPLPTRGKAIATREFNEVELEILVQELAVRNRKRSRPSAQIHARFAVKITGMS